MSLVLDGSVAIAWCIEAEQTPALMALLDEVAEQGAEASQLWPLEVTNTLIMAGRRKRVRAEERHEYIALLRDLAVTLDAALGKAAVVTR